LTRGSGGASTPLEGACPNVAYVAALVVTNVVTLLNLLLLFGVIRRLREQGARSPGAVSGRAPLPPVGALIDDFATIDTDGRPLRRDQLPDGVVVGFFSPGCEPCEALLPDFIGYAGSLPNGRERVLAVVAGTPQETHEAVARLAGVARVVVEPAAGGPVAKAFGVTGYPTLFQLDGAGRVLVSDATLDRLAVTTA
jgi:thiol-disulfide isomerase/thioredoxin